jgi:FixJ family two-component response regulator
VRCFENTGVEMTAAATVFVVGDNVGVRKSLGALLESVGLAVETVRHR